MRVLRVEHPVSKCGPYSHFDHSNPTASERLQAALHLASLTPRHPIPEEDPKLAAWCDLPLKAQQEDYIFGFATIEQLMDWFDNNAIRALLHKHGFVVVEYVATDVYIGTQQVIFSKQSTRTSYSSIPL